MGKLLIFSVVLLSLVVGNESFYKPIHLGNIPTVTPRTLDELKRALSGNTARRVIINQVFDFTKSEGTMTETGCYHKSKPQACITRGQKKLNVLNQCSGHQMTQVTYNKAGRRGLDVGSNMILVGEGNAGIKGKGLLLHKSKNVEIRNLRITDINSELIWGGDAVWFTNVNNVLIDNCFFKNIGRQMLVTNHGEPSTGLTISNSVFDGKSEHSADCNGNHLWLWLFVGAGDQITLQNNVITGTCGRGPKLAASNNQKSLLHMIQNIFYSDPGGLLEVLDGRSSVIMEGNIFHTIRKIVTITKGNIFFVRGANDAKACVPYLGRPCLDNVIVSSKYNKVTNSNTALQDFKNVVTSLAKPINMRASLTKYINIPGDVLKLIK